MSTHRPLLASFSHSLPHQLPCHCSQSTSFSSHSSWVGMTWVLEQNKPRFNPKCFWASVLCLWKGYRVALPYRVVWKLNQRVNIQPFAQCLANNASSFPPVKWGWCSRFCPLTFSLTILPSCFSNYSTIWGSDCELHKYSPLNPN